MTGTFNQKRFFDEIINGLHNKGIFKSYDEPKGMAHPQFDQKIGRDEIRPAGLYHFIGDIPPWTQTIIGRAMGIDISNEEQNLYNESVRVAIEHYVPDDKFYEYLRYFAEHLDDPAHAKLIRAQLQGDFHDQYSSRLKVNIDIHAPFLSSFSETNREKRCSHIPFNALTTLPEHPEIVLAVAIFNAAHRGYNAQLSAALERNHAVGDEERRNAEFTINRSVGLLGSGNVYNTLVPLTLQEYRQQERETDNPSMVDAISSAFATFRSERFFRGREGHGKPSVCPANVNFNSARRNGIIEMLYQNIVAHRDALEPFLEEVGEQYQKALDGMREAYHQQCAAGGRVRA